MRKQISPFRSIVSVLLALPLVAVLLAGCSKTPVKADVIGEFNANKNEFYAIASYMATTKDSILNIDKDTNNNFVVGDAKDEATMASVQQEIKDQKLDVMFKALFTIGFETMLNDYNGVFFIRVSQQNFENGVVYSTDSELPVWIDTNGKSNFTELEKIEENFYYYEGRF